MSTALKAVAIRLSTEHLEAAKNLTSPVTLSSLVRSLLSYYQNSPKNPELEALIVAEATRASVAPKATTFKTGHRPWHSAGDTKKCQNQTSKKDQIPATLKFKLPQNPSSIQVNS